MLQFEEYKVKLNNLKPQLDDLYQSLGLEKAKREVEELEIKSSQPGFWDNPEESQKIVSRMGALKGKIEATTGCTACATTCSLSARWRLRKTTSPCSVNSKAVIRNWRTASRSRSCPPC